MVILNISSCYLRVMYNFARPNFLQVHKDPQSIY